MFPANGGATKRFGSLHICVLLLKERKIGIASKLAIAADSASMLKSSYASNLPPGR